MCGSAAHRAKLSAAPARELPNPPARRAAKVVNFLRIRGIYKASAKRVVHTLPCWSSATITFQLSGSISKIRIFKRYLEHFNRGLKCSGWRRIRYPSQGEAVMVLSAVSCSRPKIAMNGVAGAVGRNHHSLESGHRWTHSLLERSLLFSIREMYDFSCPTSETVCIFASGVCLLLRETWTGELNWSSWAFLQNKARRCQRTCNDKRSQSSNREKNDRKLLLPRHPISLTRCWVIVLPYPSVRDIGRRPVAECTFKNLISSAGYFSPTRDKARTKNAN